MRAASGGGVSLSLTSAGVVDGTNIALSNVTARGCTVEGVWCLLCRRAHVASLLAWVWVCAGNAIASSGGGVSVSMLALHVVNTEVVVTGSTFTGNNASVAPVGMVAVVEGSLRIPAPLLSEHALCVICSVAGSFRAISGIGGGLGISLSNAVYINRLNVSVSQCSFAGNSAGDTHPQCFLCCVDALTHVADTHARVCGLYS